jgi:hypothetical protein
VSHHRREPGTRADERVDVVPGPVPDLDLEAGVGDAADPLLERQVQEDHLRTHGQVEHGMPPIVVTGALSHLGCRRRTLRGHSVDGATAQAGV